MAILSIKRSSEWMNKMREVELYLDGRKIGVIQDGETKEFEVEAGEHTLKSKIDWCASKTITITAVEGAPKHIEVSGFKRGKYIMPLALLVCVLHLAIGGKWNAEPLYFLILMLPFLFYMVYYLSLGRNKYLRLEEK